MRNRFLIIFVLLLQLGFSQKNYGGLVLNRPLANYGEVDIWINKIDSFLITNTTAKPLYILKQMVPRNFELRTPRTALNPGETAYIEVIYTPTKTGAFKEQLKLYHSLSEQPFFIELKGNIKSFDEFGKLACPSFSTPNYQKPTFNMQILVIDSVTRKPIKKALVELSKGEDYQQFYTDKEGEVYRKSHLGLFFVFVEANNYKSKELTHYFNPKSNSITVTLVPKQKPFIPANEIPIDEKEIIFNSNIKDSIVRDIIVYEPLSTDTEIVVVEENNQFQLSKFKKNNIVFLIDVSSSMRGKDRLDLLKKSMIELTLMLRSVDNVTIVTYADEANIALKTTSASNKEAIIAVIKALKANGSTQGGKAIKKAYKILEANYLADGNNQIILATDGGFNGLGSSERQLNWLAKRKASKGLKFSVLGFGKNKRGKDLIEALSISGQGNYLCIEDEIAAVKNLNLMIMEQSAIKK